MSAALGQSWLLGALVGLAIVFVLAHGLTYDHYGGGATRYLDWKPELWAWIAVLAACALVTTIAGRGVPRLGLLLAAPFMWACAFVVFISGIGH